MARHVIYATYGEGQFLAGVEDGDPAGDQITVFNRAGMRLFGADSLLGRLRVDPGFTEFTQGTLTPEGHLVFVADPSPLIWTVDPDTRTLQTVLPEEPVVVADHVRAVLYRKGQDGGARTGLLRLDGDAVEVAWFDMGTGRLLGRDHAVLPHGPSLDPGAWQARSVARGNVVLWRGRTALHISCGA